MDIKSFFDDVVVHERLALAWTVFGASLFPVLLFVTAPYGKHHRSGFGPLMNGRLGWFLQEIVSPLSLSLSFAPQYLARSSPSPIALLAYILWIFHYINRSIIWPIRMPNVSPTAVLVVLFAVFFNMVNGYLNGRYLGQWMPSTYPYDPILFLVGFMLFFLGWYINVNADKILGDLRKNRGDKRYYIPRGGAFEFVTSANYLGEIIEWSGFCLLSGCSYSIISFVVWTCANLIPRGYHHHLWAKEYFKDKYPKSRKAVIPFIF